MTCCETPYQLCEPIPQCVESILVYVPTDYTESDIGIEIQNGQSNGEIKILLVTNNFVELDVLDWIDGFFNPFSGIFTLRFLNPITLEVLSFVAVDGKTYNSATFKVKKVSSQTGVIDLFGYSEEGYY
jgi:hypothetical protein